MGDRGTAEAALQRRRGIYPYGGEGGKTKWGEGGRRMIRPLDRIDGGEGESGRGKTRQEGGTQMCKNRDDKQTRHN